MTKMGYTPTNHAPGGSYHGSDHAGGGADYSQLDPSDASKDASAPDYEAMQQYENKAGEDYEGKSQYQKNEKQEDEKKKEESNKPSIEDNVKKEQGKLKDKDVEDEDAKPISDGELKLRAASELSTEIRGKSFKGKSTKKSIEEAINKAVKEEKEVVFLD